MKPFTVTIEFQPKGEGNAYVSGMVKTDDGYVQTFDGDGELHAAIDKITERELRLAD